MRLEKAAALLKLAQTLASTWEGLTLDEMSEFLRSGRRTAERARDAIDSVFGPLDRLEDDRKVRFRIAARGLGNFATSPTVEELTELENAAAALLAAQAPGRAKHLQSLRIKIGASLRDSDRRRLSRNVEDQLRAETFTRQVGPRPMADASVLAMLREALLAGRVVQFDYGGDDEPLRPRKVVPYGVLFGPRYYLVARVTHRPHPVLFLMDKIHGLRITEESGLPPEDFDLRAYADQSFGVFQEEPQDVVLRFTAEAARVASAYLFHPGQAFTKEDDGSLIVRFRAGGLLELARHLLTWGAAVSVIGPQTLRDHVQQLVSALYSHHVSSDKV